MAAFTLPKRMVDFTGHTCGRLEVTGWTFKKNGKWQWICECSCGNTTTIPHTSLLTDSVKSCGCLRVDVAKKTGQANRVHGDIDSPESCTWKNIKERCYNKSNDSYASYGGRGIVVCDRWLGKDGYVNFLADMGRRPSDSHSIDRIDVNGNYEPSNCRWATVKEQHRNRRDNLLLTVLGRTQTAVAWAEEMGHPPHRIYNRLAKGWTPEEAVLTKKGGDRSKCKEGL